MTLEDLGNLGEFLGAIGVIVTLVYLAVQVLQNTRMVRANVRQARADATFQNQTMVATSDHLLEVLQKDIGGEPLEPDELWRLLVYRIGWWRNQEAIYLQTIDGLLDDHSLVSQAEVLRRVLAEGSTRQLFEDTNRGTLSPRFVTWVEEVLSETSSHDMG